MSVREPFHMPERYGDWRGLGCKAVEGLEYTFGRLTDGKAPDAARSHNCHFCWKGGPEGVLMTAPDLEDPVGDRARQVEDGVCLLTDRFQRDPPFLKPSRVLLGGSGPAPCLALREGLSHAFQ